MKFPFMKAGGGGRDLDDVIMICCYHFFMILKKDLCCLSLIEVKKVVPTPPLYVCQVIGEK